MTQSLLKPRIQLSKIDRIAFDPEKPFWHDLDKWAKLYYDGEAYPWQNYFYQHPAKDKMAVAGIRTGKTRTAGMGFVHKAMYNPGMKLLNVSISSEQAKLVYHVCLEILYQDRLQHWIHHVDRSPYPKITLINESVMDFRSVGFEGELLRGDQWDLINIDEAAYVTSEAAIVTIRGRLLGWNPILQKPRMGLLWQMTTPKGKIGWLFQRWKLGDPRYAGQSGYDPERYLSLRARTTDNPRLDMEMIRDIMDKYTDREIQQEIDGEFLDATDTEFNVDQLSECCNPSDPVVIQLYKDIERWKEKQSGRKNLRAEIGLTEDIERYELDPEPGHQYMCSWDLGKKPTKKGRNATVAMCWDITSQPWKMVAFWYIPGTNYTVALSYIEQWHDKYSSRGTKAKTVIDATGKGDVLNEIIEVENRIQVEGVTYSNVLKPNLITAGKIVVERNMIRYPFIRRMIDQMSSYTQMDKELAQDIVMSFCQLAYYAREYTGLSSGPSKIQIASTVFRRQPVGLHPLMRRAAMRRKLPRTGRIA